jgi:hypothetical protein
MRIVMALLLVEAVAAGGCSSPEAARTRGGGPGADVGNRPAAVKMHEGSRQYWKTPQRIGVESPPLESAQQARQISRQ